MRGAAAIYTLLSVATTWPLVTGLHRDVAWDLGDSLLNMWILAWDCEQLIALLHGDFSRATSFFDANIFHPAPLTLAFSEHLVPQALQVLPVYALTGNPILCYNLLFLSTFVLSGCGTYLLVREITGSREAAFVAGLLYAFAPYRLAQLSHVQVLSSQWMPFALYGVRRYFTAVPDRRLMPLLLAAVAFAVQGLSCGYYLLYFAPFFAAYVAWEITLRKAWRDRQVWCHLAVAGTAVAVLVVPFLLPYLAIRNALEMTRSPHEVAQLSADVYAYATAFSEQRIWGPLLRAYPRAEGELFPGLVPLLLGTIGLIVRSRPALGPDGDVTPATPGRRVVAWLFGMLSLGHAAVAVAALLSRRLVVDLGVVQLRVSDVTQMIWRAAVAAALLCVVWPPARRQAGAWLQARGFYLLALLAAVWLSLGPAPSSLGRPLNLASPYAWLLEHVPGFEGLRAPARYAMIVSLMLAVLGGFGVRTLVRQRFGHLVVALLAVAFLAESTPLPFVVNGVTPISGFQLPETRVHPPSEAPRVYTEGLAPLSDVVLAELPLGPPDADARAVYYSTVHWHRLLNGYSGFFPSHYGQLVAVTSDVARQANAALEMMRELGATHVLVHEGAYLGDSGRQVTSALQIAGARRVFRDGHDVLLTLGD